MYIYSLRTKEVPIEDIGGSESGETLAIPSFVRKGWSDTWSAEKIMRSEFKDFDHYENALKMMFAIIRNLEPNCTIKAERITQGGMNIHRVTDLIRITGMAPWGKTDDMHLPGKKEDTGIRLLVYLGNDQQGDQADKDAMWQYMRRQGAGI